MSLEGEAEEKIGKLYTRHTHLRGRVDQIWAAVFGNGLPGHEARIKKLEECWGERRETCPFVSDKQNRQIVIGLWINGFMMITGFIALILTLG